jgi:DNA-binding MarR family transcriptional regulator
VNPGISPGAVAEFLHVDPSSLTALLKRLVHRKLIARQVDPGDARRSHLRLLPQGAALDRMSEGTIEAGVRSALDALPPSDVASAVVVLGALSRALNDISASGGQRKAQKAPGKPRSRPGRSARRR